MPTNSSANSKKISENNEINDMKKIIGLESNRKYDDETAKKCLRYGKIMFMTDQDLDGSHIKGLGINLFQSQWHDLIKSGEKKTKKKVKTVKPSKSV